MSNTANVIRAARRTWLRGEIAEAKKALKKKGATEKQHNDAIAKLRKYSTALERINADVAGAKKGRKKKGKKKGKR